MQPILFVRRALGLALVGVACAAPMVTAAEPAKVKVDANRLTHLDDFCDPYVMGLNSAKLVTPQWVGEAGVEAVVTLGIDDMRDPAVYAEFLRPILDRLKKIDGRAPVSIMTNQVDPQDPRLQAFLKEGLSIETHTIDHPCPCLNASGFETAKSTYDRCVDEMFKVPGSQPVAFRFPCCDSQNTPSPRAFVEIMSQTTPAGKFLQMATSICVILDAADPQLPRKLTVDEQGRSRFAKYVPFPNFVNKVFNYPYPFVVAGKIWEFPIATPDDWQGQRLNQPFNPQTLADMQFYLDAVVIKRGVVNVVFHPWGWIRNDQMVALVDYAATQYGNKVKFLTFKECLERMNEHLLAGQPLRAADGGDNGVRLLDINNDGYMDVLIGNDAMQRTRLWDPKANRWIDGELPVKFVVGNGSDRRINQVRFGVVDESGNAIMLVRDGDTTGAWRFDGAKWVADEQFLAGLELDGKPLATGDQGRDLGLRLRDLDGNGVCELIVANPQTMAAFQWNAEKRAWQRLPYALPDGVWIADAQGRDGGTRFADFDADGLTDVMDSCERGTGVFLMDTMETGWTRTALVAAPGTEGAMPMFSREGVNGGGWITDRQVWFQNEETAKLPDGVFHRSFNEILGTAESRPLDAQNGFNSLHVVPGYRVELVAAEPLVMDPVAFDWGPDGKLWVVEMADYPLGIDGKGTPGGRVRYLEDTNGDGHYDKSTLFLDGVNFPNGVMAWKDGVLVTAAPELFFARDTNGDGKCDERTTIYEGFNPGNQQHRANGLRWSMDGWVHLANGDSGGVIRSIKTGQEVDISARDLRVRPDTGQIETVTGQTQFGRNRDDWGHWFGCNNSFPLYQFVLEDRYLRRNPNLAPPAPSVQVVDRSVRLFPLSRTLARFNTVGSENTFTSACSSTIYRDNALPGMAGSMLTCEPVHNLVHREVLSRDGLLFSAKRAPGEEESHFLRSTDNWFRPVMVRTAPDGSLWVADMYRETIEHPEWIPDDWEARLDLRAGHDKGRIYRIVPVANKLRPTPRLDKLTTAELVAQLNTPNGTQRDHVQRLLQHRGDKAAIAPLNQLAGQAKTAVVRAQALWTLAGLKGLTDKQVAVALGDADPRVRAQAILLAEPRLAKSPSLGEALLKLADDSDADVQLQLAYTLGEWNDPRAAETLGKLALRHAHDPYLSAAVLSSIGPATAPDVLARVLSSESVASPLVDQLITISAAGGDLPALAAALKRIASPGTDGFADWQFNAAAQLINKLRANGQSLAGVAGDAKAQLLDPILAAARRQAADETVESARRAAAMPLLVAAGDPETDLSLLAELLAPRQPIEVQLAAIRALALADDSRAADGLLANWDAYSPTVRGQVLDTLINRPAWAQMLLDRLEEGTILANQIDAVRRQQLLQSGVEAVRTRAEKLLAADTGSRQDVVDQFQSVLSMTGDRERGREVFLKRCSTCHVLEGKGYEVGADLSALTNKSPTAQLIAILDPNRAVEDKYVNYLAALEDGRQLSGVLAGESGESLTLRAQEGKDQVILRKDLETLVNTGKSLMPEGLEKDMSKQELADVIAYVGGFGPPPKKFAGNEPRTIAADDQGVLTLPASASRIAGSTLAFEPQYQNLGQWYNTDDMASWTIAVPKAGTYEVQLDFACGDAMAGKSMHLEAGDQSLEAATTATGTWDDYREVTLGRLTLPAGETTLTLRSTDPLPPGHALLDVRTIKLVPIE